MNSKRGNQMFSIDDAFEEEHTDAIRVYGATTTTERSPLNLKPRNTLGNIDAVSVHIIQNNEPPNSMSVKPIIRGLKDHDTLSRDSDSLITEEQDDREIAGKKIRENWKIVVAALLLFVLGIGLIVGGIIIGAYSGLEGGAVFTFAGIICFVPGAYHLFYVYFAVKGKRGYDLYHLGI